jgi:hypothetical protein
MHYIIMNTKIKFSTGKAELHDENGGKEGEGEKLNKQRRVIDYNTITVMAADYNKYEL